MQFFETAPAGRGLTKLLYTPKKTPRPNRNPGGAKDLAPEKILDYPGNLLELRLR